MNKADLVNFIKNSLVTQRDVAMNAAEDAHQIATHKENVAENKYDTLGLEAAYLAHGQSQRVSEYEAAIVAYNKLPTTDFDENTPIAIGALIQLADKNGKNSWVFLGPASGGVTVVYEGFDITVITPAAPLGKALTGSFVGDHIKISIAEKTTNYEIISLN